MVSYFIPRCRLFLRRVNNRQAVMKAYHTSPYKAITYSSNIQNEHKDLKVSVDPAKTDLSEQIPNPKSLVRKHRRNPFFNLGFLLRWVPVGVCVAGVIDWQLHKRKCNTENLPKTASKLQVMAYCSLPLRIISRCWGWLAACYVPVPLRTFLYGWYARLFNVNMDEALHTDYKHYPNIAEFFTRPLKAGVRVIDERAPLVSPADGKVLHFGNANAALIEQVKGVNYKIQDFLGPSTDAYSDDEAYINAIKMKSDDSTDLYQCVIYLAPGDYHRFHSPTNWWSERRRHFSGKLLSVSPKIASWLPNLFCLNERVLYTGEWKYGFFSYTAVGATNVGSVEIYKDEKLKTNRWTTFNRRPFEEIRFKGKLEFKKGDLVGQFNMGSTIVLLFEAPKSFNFVIIAGQTIRVGQPLGQFA